MSFLSKIAKVATGGLSGPPKGAGMGALTSRLIGGLKAVPPPGVDPAMGAPPQPNPMAQDVMNARRKFRMGRMGGGEGRGPMME